VFQKGILATPIEEESQPCVWSLHDEQGTHQRVAAFIGVKVHTSPAQSPYSLKTGINIDELPMLD